jgi:hypothetical protein
MPSSSLLINEFFDAADERFLREVLESRDAGALKGIAAKWAADPRPFMRELMKRYLATGAADHDGHRALAKTLFKHAEKAGDDELMGHFLVAFDGLAHRKLVTRFKYDWSSRTSSQISEMVYVKGLLSRRPKDLKKVPQWSRYRYEENKRFSLATRRYLQRRAWRYFRKLAWKEPARYVRAMTAALKVYPEDAIPTPAKLVDAWGLMHALYGESKVISRTVKGVVVAEGQTLEKLEPAPYRAHVWKDRFDELLSLFTDARCNTVRQWAIKLLRRDFVTKMEKASFALVERLLRNANEDAQQLGAELLAKVEGLESLSVPQWLSLLEVQNATAQARIVELVRKHVAPSRLTLAQCIELTKSKLAPVASLGLDWAKARPVKSEADLAALLPIAQAGVENVRKAGTEWLCSLLLLNEGAAMPLHVRELLDSKFADVRAQALTLMQKDKRFGEATALWAAMAESPWADVRETLVAQLEKREGLYGADTLRALWASSLLAFHRGGRAKAAVCNQLAKRIVEKPAEAEGLLPLLGFALRSVRAPERRVALAAVTRATLLAPALRASVEKLLPELKLPAAEAWA